MSKIFDPGAMQWDTVIITMDEADRVLTYILKRYGDIDVSTAMMKLSRLTKRG